VLATRTRVHSEGNVAARRAAVREGVGLIGLNVHVQWLLIGELELAVDDFYARTERCASRRSADREEQHAARLNDVFTQTTRGDCTRRAWSTRRLAA
jgi:hypothetical protein